MVFEQQRRRPACASTKSDQCLCYSLIGKLLLWLVSVAEETGLSLAIGLSLALSESWFCRDEAHLMYAHWAFIRACVLIRSNRVVDQDRSLGLFSISYNLSNLYIPAACPSSNHPQKHPADQSHVLGRKLPSSLMTEGWQSKNTTK